ncbi:hypothetical protein JCM19239_1477 [Vibrio variabilis]|uniref:4a-hydroxytetrahydrobiopterin dehydratase n=1 Tax=Vibrio variabilis TaxID=990271 RepID=A0ABQ0JG74_9VIBR|nr:hypothetical protein JCM19239_1477 [Vibrio variabilis]
MNKSNLQLTESEEKRLQLLKKQTPEDSLTPEEIEDFEKWARSPKDDNSPKFELSYNGSPVFIDMLTLLQCLKIAEHTHHIPPLESGWWLKVIKQYPVEIHLDGRIQTKSE